MSEEYFDGNTYNHERDKDRLQRQLARVRGAMMDGNWHTLRELSERLGDPEASVSARLRDLRKPRFGSYIVNRAYVVRGLFVYQMTEAAKP